MKNRVNTKAFSFAIIMISFLSIATLIVAVSVLLSKIDGQVPLHWSPKFGIDKWGSKKDMLTSAVIIPSVLGLLFNCGAIIAHRLKQYGVSVLCSSLTLAIVVAFASASITLLVSVL
ncbi:MAG: hypothetical protein RR993_02200 [Clostridia bacterium]